MLRNILFSVFLLPVLSGTLTYAYAENHDTDKEQGDNGAAEDSVGNPEYSEGLTRDKFGMVWSQPNIKLDQYDIIVIKLPSTKKLPQQSSFDYEQFAVAFQNSLMRELQTKELFKDVRASSDDLPKDKKILILMPEIIELNPGSQRLRRFLGNALWSAVGNAKAGVRAFLIDYEKEGNNTLLIWYGRKLSMRQGNGMTLLNMGMENLSKFLASYIERVYKEGK